MNWTKEQLQMIEKLGAAWFPFKKCAAVLEVDFSIVQREFRDERSEAFKAYNRGWLLSELSLTEGIQKMAGRGSNPAQQMARKILEDAEGRNKLAQ